MRIRFAKGAFSLTEIAAERKADRLKAKADELKKENAELRRRLQSKLAQQRIGSRPRYAALA